MVLDFRRIKERGWSFRLTWDLFMIFIAVINLLMILFDLTYFVFRTRYNAMAPELVQLYDPLKGVESNPEFEAYRSSAIRYFQESDAAVRDSLQKELSLLSEELGTTYRDFFQQTGQWQMVREMTATMHASLPQSKQLISTRQYRLQDVGPVFWTELDQQKQQEVFQNVIEPTLQNLFYRNRQLDGSFVDRFILLDAPFLLLFLLEFLGRWIYTIRKRYIERWWLFPIYNWYDILGLIPFAYFRIFRLVRILSIYIRLHRSELTTVGQDIFSRTFKRYSNILTEELSDRVAVRLLTEIQSEIRGGASLDIIVQALRENKEPLKEIVIETLQNFSADSPALDETRRLLEKSLDRAALNVPSLRFVPDFIKSRLTREIGLAVFDAMNESMVEAWQNEVGAQLISEAIDFALEEMNHPTTGQKADALYREVAVEVVENLKEAVAVKQWAQEKPKDSRTLDSSGDGDNL